MTTPRIESLTFSDVVRVLKRRRVDGFVNRLKAYYRPVGLDFKDLLKFSSPGDRVFDIGCGTGSLLTLIAEFCEPAALAGVEVAPELVGIARGALVCGVPVGIALYDGYTLPAEVREYDKVFLVDVLHHMPPYTHQRFIGNIFRKMNSGSHLILKDIDATSPLVVFNKAHDRIFSGHAGHERECWRVAGWLSDAGFDILRADKKRRLWYPHFTILAEKP